MRVRVSFHCAINILAIIQTHAPVLQLLHGFGRRIAQRRVRARLLDEIEPVHRLADLHAIVVQRADGVVKIHFASTEFADAIQCRVRGGHRQICGSSDGVRRRFKLWQAQNIFELFSDGLEISGGFHGSGGAGGGDGNKS